MKLLKALRIALLGMALPLVCQANEKTTVAQVTTSVDVTGNVDYVVNGEEPFGEEGLVNIVDKEHAVLIVERVKPSVFIKTLLTSHVKINGEAARNGQNCQVRLYGTRGCMVLPYASTDKPLTVYSGQNFEGESSSSFGLENDGGYMVTMSDNQLNNRIRSFRLKRGYMVTFATGKSGYGYQRCFIANDADVEMATLPQILDGKISSYRIFKWNTAGKKGLASNTGAGACDSLNVISCYGWDEGKNMYPDVECVANHLYEDYPSSAACGQATWTAHMKTNNEPRNSADDKPQSLNTILNNWQNLMRTGMRLCSPSSWDGSDNTDGTGFIKTFLDSIDARGWRCDLVDLHCYWLIDNFNNLGTMQSKYKRPLWISEWIWGASWNKNGAFESGKTDGDNGWAVEQICNKLNSYGFVERYFYWNSETKGKLYDKGTLTYAGKYYANMLSGMGYNKNYEKIPNTPPMRGGFSNFQVTTTDGKATISWHDYDGEYNQVMEVLRKERGGAWQTWQTIRPDDAEADYSVVDDSYAEGTRYRLHIQSFSGRDYYSSEDMEPGEAIETDNGLRYVGGNVIANGQFDMGLSGWTSGTGEPLAEPWFQVLPNGIRGGHFLQAYANKGKDDAGSLKTAFPIEPKQDYMLRLASRNAGEYIKLDARMKGESSDANKVTMKDRDYWNTKNTVFNSGDYNEALLAFRWLDAKGQLGEIQLCRLFPTREEAIADGVDKQRQRAEAVKAYNTQIPALNDELTQTLATITGTDDEALYAVSDAADAVLKALEDRRVIDSLLVVAVAVDTLNFDGLEKVQEAAQNARVAVKAKDISTARQQLQQALDQFLPMTLAATQPQSPSFEAEDGWQTKTGTFTGGDQRTATQEDKTCWNAWWSGISASEGTAKTMGIRQQLTGLKQGLYALECKATTQHNCLSDQRGYIVCGDDSVTTPQLTRDYLDVPGTPTAWQTLTSTPVYVADGGTLTIGFTGSKQGATDYAWRRYGNNETDNNSGDLREGWWCATDFTLLYHPLFKVSATPQGYGTICLPYAYRQPKGVKLYRLVGLTADYTRVCIEEVSEAEAGYPYIYLSDHADVTCFTYGDEVETPQRVGNNLYGYFFKTSSPVGAYILREDGEWYRQTARTSVDMYTAFIRKAEGMNILSEWDGPTMPIHGVVDELGDPQGIETVNASDAAPSVVYDLQGRRLPDGQSTSGKHLKKTTKKSKTSIIIR